MKSFYSKEPGYCLSATIDRYVYVSYLEHRTNSGLRVMHDTTEDVVNLDDLRNVLVKEAIRHMEMTDINATIASMSDIRAYGNGLGSSSAFTVGLLNVLSAAWYGHSVDKWNLAKRACTVEIERAGQPIGKQDQYAAAIGGLNMFTFNSDETVFSECHSEASLNLQDMSRHFLLVYSGESHVASKILQKQNEAIASDEEKFNLLKQNAYRARVGFELLKKNKHHDFGELLHEAWMDKKAIADGISTPYLDEIYEYGRRNGATGGKILGAGGGGFFLFYFPFLADHDRVEEMIANDFPKCAAYTCKFVDEGSSVTIM